MFLKFLPAENSTPKCSVSASPVFYFAPTFYSFFAERLMILKYKKTKYHVGKSVNYSFFIRNLLTFRAIHIEAAEWSVLFCSIPFYCKFEKQWQFFLFHVLKFFIRKLSKPSVASGLELLNFKLTNFSGKTKNNLEHLFHNISYI
jgi:hypothetical protein